MKGGNPDGLSAYVSSSPAAMGVEGRGAFTTRTSWRRSA